MEALRKAVKLRDGDASLELYSHRTWECVTFMFEVVYVVLGDDEVSLLLPGVLIELAHSQTDHYYLSTCYIQLLVYLMSRVIKTA